MGESESRRVPLYRLSIVRENHSALYGAPSIHDSAAIYKLLRTHFNERPQEEFVVVMLDAKHSPIAYQVVSVGSLTLSIVHPREVFKLACVANAAAIVCAHNHPSGDPAPSQEDRILTDRLAKAGEILGIRLLDHVVIGDGRYVSFADMGWMPVAD